MYSNVVVYFLFFDLVMESFNFYVKTDGYIGTVWYFNKFN